MSTRPDGAARRHLRGILAINPYRRRWPVALKAAVTLVVPLGIATALGHQDWAMTCSLGAFAVLFGPRTAGRFRARLLAVVGAGLVLSATLGALTAPVTVLHLATMIAVTVVAALLCVSLKVGPPGPVFFPLNVGVAGLAVSHGTHPGHLVLTVAIGAVTAWLVGMSDILLHPRGPEEAAVQAATAAILDYEKTPDTGPEANDAAFRQARSRASAALHAAWTTVTDGAARNVSRGRLDLIVTLRALHHRYAMRTAFSAHVASDTERLTPWADGRGEPDRGAVSGTGRTIRIDLEGLRQSSLGRPSARFLLRDAMTWPSETVLLGARIALATLLSAIGGRLLGEGHTYWAVFTAVLVLHQGGTRLWQTYRGVQRTAGTVVGVLLFAALVSVDPRGWWLVLVLGCLQFAVEMLVVRNYALASIVITPLALTTAYVAAGRTGAGTVVVERIGDTLIGVAAALLVLWTTGRRTPLLFFRGQGRRCILAMEAVMADVAAGVADTVDARERRRVLYFELLEYEGVGDRAVADDPAAVRPYWAMRDAVVELGYFVLGACWHPVLRQDTARFARARQGFAGILAAPVTVPRAADDIEADVVAVHRLIADWDGLDDEHDEHDDGGRPGAAPEAP